MWEGSHRGFPPAFLSKTADKRRVYGQAVPVPETCGNLTADHSDYVALLRTLRRVPGVKKVFIRSGVRFDYVMADRNREFLHELVKHHVSGQLRVAPEHVSDQVLYYMGKPRHEVYQSFLKAFEQENKKAGQEQYAVPYFMSSHPGCTLKEAVKLAEYVRDLGVYAGAGAGFLSYSVHSIHLYVLYGDPPSYEGKSLCTQGSA